MSANIERKRKARVQRIIDAGARLFASKGYHATRMQDIADVLDLQKGSLYYYFPSKEALLFQIIEDELGRALGDIEAVMGSEEEPLAKIERSIRNHLVVFHRYADIYSIFLFEKVNYINKEAAAKVDEMGRRYEEYWVELLQTAVSTGALSATLDLKLATKAIMGMCNMTLIWFDPEGRMPIETIAQHFTHYILHGMMKTAPQQAQSNG